MLRPMHSERNRLVSATEVDFQNGQFRATDWEYKCPSHNIIAAIGPNTSFFVGSTASNMVVLLGASIGSARVTLISQIENEHRSGVLKFVLYASRKPAAHQ